MYNGMGVTPATNRLVDMILEAQGEIGARAPKSKTRDQALAALGRARTLLIRGDDVRARREVDTAMEGVVRLHVPRGTELVRAVSSALHDAGPLATAGIGGTVGKVAVAGLALLAISRMV
jgi:hypothetical protein